MFNFNKRFQIHDDIDILKRMGLLFGKMTNRQNHSSHISNLIEYKVTIFFYSRLGQRGMHRRGY